MKILGIDEAGRGPVLGSLIVAGVVCEEEEQATLMKIGVKDSKKLSPERREEIFEELVSSFTYRVVEFTPREIDSRHRRRETLNQMEARAMIDLINHFSPDVAYIDCIGPSTEKFASLLANAGIACSLVVEHRADERYPIVSAASIIAKVIRDRKLEMLKQEYGDFGSGYPSDPRTVAFLEEHIGKGLPPFVRNSWRTLSRFKNRSLDSFE
jgi:ribonuclease HII